LVLGSWFLVLGSWFLVLGSWFLVLGSWFLVLGSWFLVLGSCFFFLVLALIAELNIYVLLSRVIFYFFLFSFLGGKEVEGSINQKNSLQVNQNAEKSRSII
jgi:hypothetical protein